MLMLLSVYDLIVCLTVFGSVIILLLFALGLLPLKLRYADMALLNIGALQIWRC